MCHALRALDAVVEDVTQTDVMLQACASPRIATGRLRDHQMWSLSLPAAMQGQRLACYS